MLIYKHEKPRYIGGNPPMDSFPVKFLTNAMNGEPFIYFELGPTYSLPLDEARRLARKILSMPTPIGFQDKPD